MKFLLLVALFSASTGFARGEFALGTMSSGFDVRGSGVTDDFDDFTFSAAGGYDLRVTDLIQLGGEMAVAWGIVPGPNSFTLGIYVGPTFNFGGALSQAFFVAMKVGIIHADNGTASDSVIDTYLAVGKRIALSKAFTYKPGLTVHFSPETNNAYLSLQLIRFSYFF